MTTSLQSGEPLIVVTARSAHLCNPIKAINALLMNDAKNS